MTLTRSSQALDRLERLVSIETPSGDAARLDVAHALLTEWGSEALGRAPERVVRDGVPHLAWRATASPEVVLICHVDTVFPAGTIEQRPFRVEGSRAFGPGVFDMKAGIVIALEALAKVARPECVSLVITGDEETGSITSRALVESVASTAKAALVLEPSIDGALKVGRKGGSFYNLTFHGVAAHAGLEPERGRSALLELARWALQLPELADRDKGTSVTPTVAHAGTVVNAVPDHAVLSVDVRATTLAEMERVDAALRDLTAPDRQPHPSGVSVTLDGGINRPPMEAEGSLDLVELCRQEARRLGLSEPDAVAVGGGSDGNFTAALGIPTLDGLGPAGHGAHAVHEYVELESLHERAALVAGMIDVLTGARV